LSPADAWEITGLAVFSDYAAATALDQVPPDLGDAA
jgi:hypothetical protein